MNLSYYRRSLRQDHSRRHLNFSLAFDTAWCNTLVRKILIKWNQYKGGAILTKKRYLDSVKVACWDREEELGGLCLIISSLARLTEERTHQATRSRRNIWEQVKTPEFKSQKSAGKDNTRKVNMNKHKGQAAIIKVWCLWQPFASEKEGISCCLIVNMENKAFI